MRGFGHQASGNQEDYDPVPSDAETGSFCFRNQYTCCTRDHFSKAKSDFDKKIKEFQEKIDIVEELLTLFVGGNFIQFMKDAAAHDECKNMITTKFITRLKDDKITFDIYTK